MAKDNVVYITNKFTNKPDAVAILNKGDKGDPGRQGPAGETGDTVDFYFIATEGQKVFALTSTYAANKPVAVYIGGVGQSRAKGDFFIVNKTLTLSDGVPQGTEVFGQYEVARNV